MRHPLPIPFLLIIASVLMGCASRNGADCPDCVQAGAVVTPVAKTAFTASGQPIRFPQCDAEVSASIYMIPVGAKLPVHKHPYPRFAYVMEGDIRVTLENGKSNDYHAGDLIAEVVDTWHSGATIGTKPVKLFVLDATPPGVANVVKK